MAVFLPQNLERSHSWANSPAGKMLNSGHSPQSILNLFHQGRYDLFLAQDRGRVLLDQNLRWMGSQRRSLPGSISLQGPHAQTPFIYVDKEFDRWNRDRSSIIGYVALDCIRLGAQQMTQESVDEMEQVSAKKNEAITAYTSTDGEKCHVFWTEGIQRVLAAQARGDSHVLLKLEGPSSPSETQPIEEVPIVTRDEKDKSDPQLLHKTRARQEQSIQSVHRDRVKEALGGLDSLSLESLEARFGYEGMLDRLAEYMSYQDWKDLPPSLLLQLPSLIRSRRTDEDRSEAFLRMTDWEIIWKKFVEKPMRNPETPEDLVEILKLQKAFLASHYLLFTEFILRALRDTQTKEWDRNKKIALVGVGKCLKTAEFFLSWGFEVHIVDNFKNERFWNILNPKTIVEKFQSHPSRDRFHIHDATDISSIAGQMDLCLAGAAVGNAADTLASLPNETGSVAWTSIGDVQCATPSTFHKLGKAIDGRDFRLLYSHQAYYSGPLETNYYSLEGHTAMVFRRVR